jgi:hypothetical protein
LVRVPPAATVNQRLQRSKRNVGVAFGQRHAQQACAGVVLQVTVDLERLLPERQTT